MRTFFLSWLLDNLDLNLPSTLRFKEALSRRQDVRVDSLRRLRADVLARRPVRHRWIEKASSGSLSIIGVFHKDIIAGQIRTLPVEPARSGAEAYTPIKSHQETRLLRRTRVRRVPVLVGKPTRRASHITQDRGAAWQVSRID